MVPNIPCLIEENEQQQRPRQQMIMQTSAATIDVCREGDDENDALNRTAFRTPHVPSSRLPGCMEKNDHEKRSDISSSTSSTFSKTSYRSADFQKDNTSCCKRQRSFTEKRTISTMTSTSMTPICNRSTADCEDNKTNDFCNILKQTKEELLSLSKGSTFFKFNKPRPLPSFELHQVQLGKQLGQGQFGTVWEVNRFSVPKSIPAPSKPPDKNNARNHRAQLIFDLETPMTSPAPLPLFRRLSAELTKKDDALAAVAQLSRNTGLHDLDDEKAKQEEVYWTQVWETEDNAVDDGDMTETDTEEDVTMQQAWEAEDLTCTHKSNQDIFDCFDSPAELKRSMVRNVHRTGLPRYALKQARKDLFQQQQQQETNSKRLVAAVIDLAREAIFLQSLNHPNICKIRATCGEPGSTDFGIIIDCMVFGTLRRQIQRWQQFSKAFKRPGAFLGKFAALCCQGSSESDEALEEVYKEQLNAVLDISRGMEYLHSKHIIYRDLKPDNIGINVRGDFRIFDFGLAKELRVCDMVQAPNGYNATGMAGTGRYMAPEVAKGLPYGLPADVHSFSILAWQLLTLQIPFANMTPDVFFKQVVQKGVRPRGRSIRSKTLRAILTRGWSTDPEKRPSFVDFRRKLKVELNAHAGGGTGQSSDDNMSNKSLKSMLLEREK